MVNPAQSPAARLRALARALAVRSRAFEMMLLAVQVCGVLTSVLIARSLGPSGRGLITTLATWSQLLGWVAVFSLDKAIIVLARDDKDRIDPDRSLANARVSVLLLTFPVIAISILLGYRFFGGGPLVPILAATAALTAQYELVSGWFLGRGQQSRFLAWRLAQPMLYLLAVVATIVLVSSGESETRISAVGIGLLVSIALPLIVASAWLLPWRLQRDVSSMRIIRFAAATQVANSLQYLNNRMDILTLSVISTPTQVGYYAVGAAVGQVTLFLGTAGLFRGMTGDVHRSDPKGILLTALFAGGVIALSPLLVPMVFGSSFTPAVRVAQILSIGGVLNFALLTDSGRLLGAGKPWSVAIVHAAGIPAFAIGILVSPTLNGIALASTASYAVSLAVAEAFLRLRSLQPQVPVASDVATDG